jgi:RNA polymerase sigma-70 factor (ECF subfamily)
LTSPSAPSPALDEQEVRHLYREQRAHLLRYVTRLTHDPQRAEDIVQETLLRAWLCAEQQPPGWRPPRAWLFRVAHNLVVDHHRREQTRRETPHDQALEAEASPVDEADRAIQRRFVVQALSRLSPPHRETLVQVYLLDRTGPDAAQALGIPPGTVKSRVYHALRELRSTLPAPAAA